MTKVENAMRNMVQFKSPNSLDPHTGRNQCKLIWDSTSKAPIKKGQATPKVKSAALGVRQTVPIGVACSPSSGNSGSQSRRRSLVAARISFFEEPKSANQPEKKSASHNVDTSTVQVKISFDDHATTTFEYEAEDSALENYLHDHPEERDEVLKQEEAENESLANTEKLLSDSPRAPEPDQSAMKSNTVIGDSGKFTSYKSKIQTQEFQFGMSMEPEVETYDSRDSYEQEDTEDSMQLLPADDNDLDAFSAEVGKSDMLF